MRLLIDIAEATLLRAKLRRSIIAAVGVMFCIAMFVTLLGFMNGLNQLLDTILNRTPHVRLYNELKVFDQQPIDLVHSSGTPPSAWWAVPTSFAA
ncbi:MAG: hypothetical protein IPH60_00020 [Flavobacteriales bacterium]|nr:hypothetical protein [Flavobacteriales bacterium]